MINLDPEARRHPTRPAVGARTRRCASGLCFGSNFIAPGLHDPLRRGTRIGWRFVLAMFVLAGAFCTMPAAAAGPPAGESGALAEARWDTSALMSRAWSLPSLVDALGHDDAAVQTSGYRWRGPMASQPDWQGLRRDTGYFLAYQFAVIAVLYVAPVSVSGWEDEQKQNFSFEKWRNNVRNPVWDSDRWYVNYILHPYWGGAYYIRGRERGLSRSQSFWYSAMLSTIYEYGAEALFEPVSIQDLFVTPIVGSLIGEYLFSPWRASIRAKPGALDWSDKAVLLLTDPLGVANAQMDDWLGVKTTLTFQPIGARYNAAGRDGVPAGLPGPSRSRSPAWGLHLSLQW